MIDKSQAVASLAPQPANLVVATGISNCRWTNSDEAAPVEKFHTLFFVSIGAY
jgi:hypothetical protein